MVGQRLTRRVCQECAAEYAPDPGDLARMGLTEADGPFRRGAGCERCRQTGYRGRLALYEVQEADDRLRDLILEDAPIARIWEETLRAQGATLWDDARRKVRDGLTTAEEVVRVMVDYPHPAPAP